MVEEKYYFVSDGSLGITNFQVNPENELTGLESSRDKTKWKRYTKEEADWLSQESGYLVLIEA